MQRAYQALFFSLIYSGLVYSNPLQPTKVLTGHSSFVNAAVFSKDGQSILSGSRDKTIKAWDVNSGQITKTFDAGVGIEGLDWSADGKTMVSTSFDGKPRVWDFTTGEQRIFGQNTRGAISLSDDGSRALTTGNEKTYFWSSLRDNQVTLQEVDTRYLRWSRGPVASVISRDGTFAVILLASARIFYDLEANQPIDYVDYYRSYETKPCVALDDQNHLAFIYSNRALTVWNLYDKSSKNLEYRIEDPNIIATAISADGSIGVTISEAATLVWNLQTQKLIHELENAQGPKSVAVSKDGKRVATAGQDQIIRLWDLPSTTTK